ncbi:IspD/TarI family cytidylyltransferase [Helicobacter turcicus]|uniref:2-C-methyl-D-erythritol 4-phosphate cytidylyltransferase n=1 Tax=Helicobacter turcicus TaxID=2867412 RepID=A0ABS7JPW1_9HELI|nr:IspD/TarI family cytidylyltransferase [Helicobacter turcicus]MBX7491428.1 2-C-methyl-D-erythritol 4-phosphate cytidylyltransferase [Helicobacter turcicus]MBX7545888.1 2-C-methyl-D-erythritol 4-phosphate cytidylyltransferase [Helicobacter turcicus]
MKIAVVLAGGIGKRMGDVKLPKQFLEINGIATIVLTLKNLLDSRLFDSLYIVIHKDWRQYLYELLTNSLLQIPKENIICGGRERIDSIENALDILKAKGTNPDDIVLFHDAVRPFITKELLDRGLCAALKYGACVAITPVKDTMIIVENEVALAMPNRSSLFHGQAPDIFKFGLIYDCIKSLKPEEKLTITGTAQICQRQGVKVHTYLGDERNIKITSIMDLFLAKAIYREMYEQ